MNIGWQCTTNNCHFQVIRDHRAANDVMSHIKRQHPDEWETGEWSMRGIKCPHTYLDMDGICKRCGEDRRGG